VAWTARRVPYSRVRILRETLDVPEALAWTLVRRGLDTPELAREFIDADGPLDPPESLAGVTEVAERLIVALGRGERIAIHGDYDCDGVCSTAILARPLRAAGADVHTYLPSRFTDGYGVRVETVERLADEGVAVLVCVDCGTSAVDALARAHAAQGGWDRVGGMGRSCRGGPGGKTPGRFRAGVSSELRTRSGGRNSQSAGTGAYPDCGWRREEREPAPGTQAALGRGSP